MRLSLRILSFLVVPIFVLAVAAQAKPVPPPNLMKVFTIFLQGEELVEENDWVGLDKWIGEINTQFQEMRPVLAKESGTEELGKFEKVLSELRSAGRNKKHDPAHDKFIETHRAFIDFLDEFEFKVPPLVFLVQNDFKEALESLNNGDMDEVSDELKDIELFYSKAIPELRARQISNVMIDDFKTQFGHCKNMLSTGNRKALATELAQLQQLLAVQIRQINGN